MKNKRWILPLLLCAVLLCACRKQEAARSLDVHFYDMPELDGQWGDCTLFSFPDGSCMLVDCGIKAAGETLVSDLHERGIERIDVLVLTHFHSDHVGSYPLLAEEFEIGQVYSPGYVSEQFQWLEDDIAAREIPYRRLAAGDSFSIGGANADVLWPAAELVEKNPTLPAKDNNCVIDTNNRSLVFKLQYGETGILMTADVFKKAQQEILSTYSDQPEKLSADLLKVPHHGYDNAVCADFIDAVSPRYAVMEGNHVMTNVSYRLYTKAGCTAYATWMNGAVDVKINLENYEITAADPTIKDYYR